MIMLAATQPEHEMLSHIAYIDFSKSELISMDAFGVGASIWKSPANPTGSVAFWIGPENGLPLDEFRAYLMLLPSSLGGLSVLEAKKGWTRDTWRRQGLGSALLRQAARLGPLVSDSDSMSVDAFHQWSAVKGFERKWWNASHSRFVDEVDVPVEDRLTGFEDGRPWRMVLQLT